MVILASSIIVYLAFLFITKGSVFNYQGSPIIAIILSLSSVSILSLLYIKTIELDLEFGIMAGVLTYILIDRIFYLEEKILEPVTVKRYI